MRDSVYDSLGTIVELAIIEKDEEKNKKQIEKIPELKLKSFRKHSTIFVEIIRNLFEHYRVIELISYKIEKVLNYFFSYFCDKNEEKSKVLTEISFFQINFYF